MSRCGILLLAGRNPPPEIADPLHQRALSPAQSGWQFAAPVLHLADSRPPLLSPLIGGATTPRLWRASMLKRSLTRRSILKTAALTPPALAAGSLPFVHGAYAAGKL